MAVLRTLRWVHAHPGYDGMRTLVREGSWQIRSRLGRSATVPFAEGRFYCPPERRGIARLAYLFGDRYEPDLRRLGDLVRPGATVLDVGAHYGSYTLVLAKAVGQSGRVVAVEPSARAVGVLRHNLALNGLRNVRVVHAAVGAQPGRAVLDRHADPSRTALSPDGGRGEGVDVVRIDDLVDHADFVKIDVEGAELLGLRGAAGLLERSRPTILTEHYPAAAQRLGLPPHGTWDLLTELGYRLSGSDGSPLPGPPAGCVNLLARA